jgi:hypothetical protein
MRESAVFIAAVRLPFLAPFAVCAARQERRTPEKLLGARQ